MTAETLELANVEVTAGIICRHGHILATQRPEGKPMAGYWEFPGGKREAGESLEESLCRELAEELGINVTSMRLWRVIGHTYLQSGVHALIHFFWITGFEGEPCPNEGQNIRWIATDELEEFDFLPADAEVLKALLAQDFKLP